MSYRASSSSSNTRGSAPRPPSFGSGSSSSSHRSSMNVNSTPSRKPSSSVSPVCVHCRNLGLSFDHWLRKSPEPDSPVVCPVLLKTECRYCHELGHTVGGCPAKKRSMARQNSSSSYTSFVVPSPSDIARTSTIVAPALHAIPARSTNAYSAFDTSSDSGSDNGSTSSSLQSNNTIKRIDVASLFAPKNTKTEVVPSYPTNAIRVDVTSLFSPVSVPAIEVEKPRSDITYIQLPLDADGLHEHDYDWTTYGDPEVDRQVAERRALFTSGKSWADICDDEDE